LKWDDERLDKIFGKSDNAGWLLFSDVRLLLLPVRSLPGVYRWVTCPLVLERYQRDSARCAITLPAWTNDVTSGDTPGMLTAGKCGGEVLLEEREFTIRGSCPDTITQAIAKLIRHPATQQRLAQQIAIITDDDFAWFCRYALPIQARNVLKKDQTKKSENLWYEESLPPDSVLYAIALARRAEAEGVPAELFPDSDPYLQLGGNETVGQGWFAVTIPAREKSLEERPRQDTDDRTAASG
jgi:CRISPR-associated protein Cmr4